MTEDASENLPATVELVQRAIHFVRGQQVMLDEELALLYGVEARLLNQAAKRNPDRFPPDFMFQLTEAEWDALKSRLMTPTEGRGGRRYLPLAFTQEGVAMLSSVLRSERAVRINVEIMRAFVRYRQFLASHDDLAAKLRELESRFEGKFDRHDKQMQMLVEAVRRLREDLGKPPVPPAAPKRRIGFHADDPDPKAAEKKSPRRRKTKAE